MGNQCAQSESIRLVAAYQYTQDKLEELGIAEKNLNRNIDSKAQLDIFLETAKDVKDNFTKRYTNKEWTPEGKPEDPIIPE